MPRTDPRPRGANSPISAARLAAGLTQAQLAAAVGCTQKDISRWERGTCAPKAETVYALSKVLGCPMEKLIK